MIRAADNMETTVAPSAIEQAMCPYSKSSGTAITGGK
jgi:hypothetical protein